MWEWRTSTWIYICLAVAAVAAEVVYAVNDNSDLQGHALAYLIVATVIFCIYRLLTPGRSRQRDPSA